MNKKLILFITIFICIFSCTKVFADSTGYVKIIGTLVTVRKGPSTKYDSIGSVNEPDKYRALKTDKVADEANNGKCPGGWYNIDYNGTSGYVCSTYGDLQIAEASSTCITELTNKQFPTDYATSLCQLSAVHPNWQFVAVLTNQDWSTAVAKESKCGKSYIQTSNSNYIDSSCTSAYSSTSSWKPASQTAVAYYMDPRNWLNEKTIFQFNTNKYEDNLASSYTSLSRNIIKSTNFYSYHFGIGNDIAELTNQAGSLSDVRISPLFISSRMVQELGSGTSEYNLYSGVYSGYEGYYNFFNIGVSDSCATTNGTAACGLSYAKNSGWNSPLNAIKGGAQFIATSYVNRGQYTTYLQKFNVTPSTSTSMYTHQYMTNIAAPQSEAKSMYSSISSANLLDSPFVFYIPVYNNMGASITNSSSGAVEDTTNTDKTSTSVETLVTSVGYKYVSDTIQGISINSNISDVIGTLESVSGSGNVTITDALGNKQTSGLISTGMKLTVTTSTGAKTLTVIVRGDTSGDGKVTALDLLQVQKQILGTYNLEGVYNTAGDTSGDGKITALDLLQVQKQILGTYSISQ